MLSDPTNGHGFMIKLQTEEVTRRTVLASSDNSTAALRPKLVVYYTK